MDEFEKYKLLFIEKFQSNDDDLKTLKILVASIHQDLIEIKTAIKVRQSIFAFIAATVGSIITLAVNWLIARSAK